MSEMSSTNRGAGNSFNLLNVEMMNEKEELKAEIKKVNIELNEKIIENENYQQELYELRNKLKACLATQKDLSCANELMEENFRCEKTATEKKIDNLLEKLSAEKKKYEERVSELQTSLSNEEKKNEELRKTLSAKEKLFTTLRSENPDKTQEILSLKEEINCLIDELNNREKIEGELLSRQQTLEETIATLQKNYNEVHDILQVKKEDLASLNNILRTTREELVVCRSELESLKAVPASDSMKGNSLFAEIEDNRKKLINDMSLLTNKYLQMKQTYSRKENEIRSLKAENAALLIKLEDESVLAVNHSGRLIETYKSRISELETRLKVEEKKQKMKVKEKDKEQEQAENNFSYLQTLLTKKKKEIEELVNKLEESSIQKIIQEEIKWDIERQLRQWKYKAMSYQAQLLAEKNHAKCNECLKIKPEDSGDAEFCPQDMDPLGCQSAKNLNNPPSLQEINSFDSTLEKLLQVPTVSIKEDKNIRDHSTADGFHKSGCKNVEGLEFQRSIDMEETLPVSSRYFSPRKSIPDHESNKENNASASNVNEMLLKSSLAKLEDKSLCLKGEERTKKSLRFATDTVDNQKPKLTRQKTEKKSYPIVFISSSGESKK